LTKRPKPKVGEIVNVTIPAKVLLVGRAGYMAQVVEPTGFVYFPKKKKKRG
jgi:hypothetical protein